MNTVHELRKSGVKVRIFHHRYLRGNLLPLFAIRELGMSNQVDSKGGLTIVEITKGTETVRALARCSREDAFSYKEGVKLALERATAQLSPTFLDPTEAFNKIVAKGSSFFSVDFIKRTNGERRSLNGRLNVKKYSKGGSLKFDPTKNKLLSVYDLKAKGYRFVPLDSVIAVK